MEQMVLIAEGERVYTNWRDEMVSWPYAVYAILNDPNNPIALVEGRGVMQSGGSFSAEALLQKDFEDFVTYCRLEWSVEWIKAKKAAGIPITGEMILQVSRERR